MKYYDIIMKRGNTYRVDELEYQKVLQKMNEGKMFVIVNGTPINVSMIAEMPPAKVTEADLRPERSLTAGEVKPFDPNGKGYKYYLKMRKKFLKKFGGSSNGERKS